MTRTRLAIALVCAAALGYHAGQAFARLILP